MNIYVYVVAKDGGFAPNPFHGVCTLACCKPKIRSRAQIGDWVLGLTPKKLGSRLVYAMRVDEVLDFADYFRDLRYGVKKPKLGPGTSLVQRNGDNCYKPVEGGELRQLPSMHYDNKNGRERPDTRATDLKSRHVLCARHFAYFGKDAESVPTALAFMVPGRGHRSRFTLPEKKAILEFVEALPRGMHACPRCWNEVDESWKRHSRCD